MEWYKSFESVSKLLIMIAGIILIFMGQTETGIILLSSTGVLFIAKSVDKNKNGNGGAVAIIFLCGILLFASTGCQMLGELPGEVIDLNLQVYDTYDKYVLEDGDLDEFQRQQLLRSTAILRQIMVLLRSGATSIDLMLVENPPAVSAMTGYQYGINWGWQCNPYWGQHSFLFNQPSGVGECPKSQARYER